MKIILTLAVLSVLSLTAQEVYSTSFTDHGFTINTRSSDKKKTISIVSSRLSGDMQLRFTAEKAGEAKITILNESGKIVLRQTSQVITSINTIPLKNVKGLNEGSYTLRLISNNKAYTTSFLIWK
jgi:hypothetical protein